MRYIAALLLLVTLAACSSVTPSHVPTGPVVLTPQPIQPEPIFRDDVTFDPYCIIDGVVFHCPQVVQP